MDSGVRVALILSPHPVFTRHWVKWTLNEVWIRRCFDKSSSKFNLLSAPACVKWIINHSLCRYLVCRDGRGRGEGQVYGPEGRRPEPEGRSWIHSLGRCARSCTCFTGPGLVVVNCSATSVRFSTMPVAAVTLLCARFFLRAVLVRLRRPQAVPHRSIDRLTAVTWMWSDCCWTTERTPASATTTVHPLYTRYRSAR